MKNRARRIRVSSAFVLLLAGLFWSAGAADAVVAHGVQDAQVEQGAKSAQAANDAKDVKEANEANDDKEATAAQDSTQKKLISLSALEPPVTPVWHYSGDFLQRSTLVGDPGGKRTSLYDRGIMIDAMLTQVYQGVGSGGTATGATYDGLLDYSVIFDTGKLGWWSKGMINVTAQTGWGTPLSSEPGGISPVNNLAMYPAPFENGTYLNEYYLMQALPHEIMLMVGRINATDFVDKNRFANDWHNQFLNVMFNNDLLLGEFLSFSTYAALLDVPVTKNLSLAFAAWDPETTPGDYAGVWEHFGVGGVVEYKWEIGNGLGGVVTPFFLFTNKDATAVDNPWFAPGLLDGDGLKKNSNRIFQLSVEQYLWKPKAATGTELEAHTRAFAYQAPGLGFYLRWGNTPEDRNPWNESLSAGVSGRGLIEARPYDRIGFGFYRLFESQDLKDDPLIGRLLTSETGWEIFYELAITPWLQLSADLQWVNPGIAEHDNAFVWGTRLFTSF